MRGQYLAGRGFPHQCETDFCLYMLVKAKVYVRDCHYSLYCTIILKADRKNVEVRTEDNLRRISTHLEEQYLTSGLLKQVG